MKIKINKDLVEDVRYYEAVPTAFNAANTIKIAGKEYIKPKLIVNLKGRLPITIEFNTESDALQAFQAFESLVTIDADQVFEP